MVYAAEDTIPGEPTIQFGVTPVFFIVPWLTGVHQAKEFLRFLKAGLEWRIVDPRLRHQGAA